jgi:hypothetical protein
VTGPVDTNARADAAMSLVLAAAGAERRNRPRTLVLAAVALLVAAGLFTLFSYQSLARARGAIALQHEQTRTIEALAGEIAATMEQESRLIFDPDATVASKLESIGQIVGLETPVLIDQKPGGAPPGTVNVVKRLYNTRSPLRSLEIGPLVRWLEKACDGSIVQGLTPTSIRLRALRTGPTDKPAGPGEADWELDVKFARIEREERGSGQP